MQKYTNGLARFLLLFSFLMTVFSIKIVIAGTNTNEDAVSENRVDTEKNQRAEEFLKKGNAFADKGLTKKAHEYWKIALELNPELPEAWQNLGLSPATKKAEDSPSLTALEFESDPDRPYNNLVKNFFDKAVDELRRKDYSQALGSIDQAKKMDPSNSQVEALEEWIQSEYSNVFLNREVERAREQLESGNEEIASEIIDNILLKHPDCQPALNLKEKIKNSEEEGASKINDDLEKAAKKEKNNQFAAARELYEKILEIDPKNDAALKGLGRIPAAIDPLQEKLKKLNSAIALNDRRKAEEYLAEIKQLAPRYPKLDELGKRVSQLMPNSIPEDSGGKADEAYNLGLESYRKGDLVNAKKFWSDVLELNPRHEQARRNLDRLKKEHPELE